MGEYLSMPENLIGIPLMCYNFKRIEDTRAIKTKR